MIEKKIQFHEVEIKFTVRKDRCTKKELLKDIQHYMSYLSYKIEDLEIKTK